MRSTSRASCGEVSSGSIMSTWLVLINRNTSRRTVP
jgi:hypothetical protein